MLPVCRSIQFTVAASLSLFFPGSFADAVEITGVSISSASKVNLCKKLGGYGKAPIITIRHEKKKGDIIKVRMYDVLTGAGKNPIEHRTKKTRSEADGTTVLEANFLPPCNTTGGRRNSSYRFDVSSKGSSKTTKRWFSFNSKSKKISN